MLSQASLRPSGALLEGLRVSLKELDQDAGRQKQHRYESRNHHASDLFNHPWVQLRQR
jgi:hypothetical protein